MVSFVRIVVVGVLAVFISACQGTFPASPDFRLQGDSKDGLVIMSFTQPSTGVSWYYRNVENLEDTSSSATRWIETGRKFTEDKKTFLNPVVLPGGEYLVYRWFAGTLYSPKLFYIRLNSVPGKVVYAGNIRLSLEGQRFKLDVKDNREKDIPLFLKHYRNINQDQIEYRIMKFEGFVDSR